MAQIVSLKRKAHNNIYKQSVLESNYREREIEIEMGIPENGVNENTCMLVVIPGYGGNLQSNIYQKMRNTFPDQYNMVVLQCDYFGNRFMQNITCLNIQMDDYGADGKEYEVDSEETIEEFNDMGIMQALDVVNATLSGIEYIRDREEGVDIQKVILFGTSHGAYLAHLANLICPELYSHLIDISAYTKPYYLEEPRRLDFKTTDWIVRLTEEYLVKKNPDIRYHDSLYDLRFLYPSISNQCKIIAFQGTEDWMVNYQEKVQFIQDIGNMAEILLIQKTDVDGKFCKNANHDLGMDFVILFQMLMPMLQKSPKRQADRPYFQDEVVLGNEEARMCIDYKAGLPELKYITFHK